MLQADNILPMANQSIAGERSSKWCLLYYTLLILQGVLLKDPIDFAHSNSSNKISKGRKGRPEYDNIVVETDTGNTESENFYRLQATAIDHSD